VRIQVLLAKSALDSCHETTVCPLIGQSSKATSFTVARTICRSSKPAKVRQEALCESADSEGIGIYCLLEQFQDSYLLGIICLPYLYSGFLCSHSLMSLRVNLVDHGS
jgi:hypothetical protein